MKALHYAILILSFFVVFVIGIIVGQNTTLNLIDISFSPATCTIDGMVYQAGDSFTAPDGCNTCTCSENGQAACTLMACADDIPF